MIRPQRNSFRGPTMDLKPPGSHRFPESKTTHPEAYSDVRISLILEGEWLSFQAEACTNRYFPLQFNFSFDYPRCDPHAKTEKSHPS